MVEDVEIPFTYELTPGPDAPRELRRQAFRSVALGAPVLVASAGTFVVTAAIGAASDPEEGRDGVWLVAVLLVAAVCAVVVLAASTILQWAGTRSLVRIALPDGVRLQTGFGAGAYVTNTAQGTLRVPYDAIRSVVVRGGLVLVRLRRPRRMLVHPIELFPPREIERVERALAASGS